MEFKVFIDNVKVGSISDGEEKTIEITEGNHKILLKINWCKSKMMVVNLNGNEEIKLKCGSVSKVGITSLFIKDKFIHLDYYSSYCFDTSDYLDEIIKKGKKHFIVKNVLWWCMTVGVINFIDSSFFGFHHYKSIISYIISLISSLIFWSVCGYFFATYMWLFLKWWNE